MVVWHCVSHLVAVDMYGWRNSGQTSGPVEAEQNVHDMCLRLISQFGGFGSVCCLFTSVCLSWEAKSVRFGSGELLRRLEDEDTAVRGSANALRCAHAY